MTSHRFPTVNIDQGLAEEAVEIADTGVNVGWHISGILDEIDKRRAGLSVAKLQDIFDCILESICEHGFNHDQQAYDIIHAKASVMYRPCAHPNGEPGAQQRLDDAMQAYAQISDEDLDAEEGENP